MDPLTTRLAEALRLLAEDITHEDHEPGDWSVQVALRRANEALAAYDERVAAEAPPGLTRPSVGRPHGGCNPPRTDTGD